MGIACQVIHLRFDIIVRARGKDLVVQDQGTGKISEGGAGLGNLDLQIQTVVQAGGGEGGVIGIQGAGIVFHFDECIAPVILNVSIQHTRDVLHVVTVGGCGLVMLSQPRIGASHQERRPGRIRGLGVIGNERNKPLDCCLVIPIGELGTSQSPESCGSQVWIGGIVIGGEILIAGRVIIPVEQRFIPGIDSHDGGKGRQGCRRLGCGGSGGRTTGCESSHYRRRSGGDALAGGNRNNHPQPDQFSM